MNAYFDRAAFLEVLNAIRLGRGASWAKAAEESGVKLCVLQKLMQTNNVFNPSLHTFVRLIVWAGLDANAFIVRHVERERTA